MKQLAGFVLALLASGCSAVGYHGGAVTVTDGYFLEKKITPLSGRDVQITIWAHANSDGVLEQTLREEARAYGLRQDCPSTAVENMVFGLSNAMLDARRFVRATVRCQNFGYTGYNNNGYGSPQPLNANAPLPEPLIQPNMNTYSNSSSTGNTSRTQKAR